MKPTKNKLAERLKSLRVARGLTQRDMARQFRFSDVGFCADPPTLPSSITFVK